MSFLVGYRGKLGAAGVMVGGAITVLQALLCAIGVLGHEQLLMAALGDCWTQAMGGAVVFAGGLSQFGIRAALPTA